MLMPVDETLEKLPLSCRNTEQTIERSFSLPLARVHSFTTIIAEYGVERYSFRFLSIVL